MGSISKDTRLAIGLEHFYAWAVNGSTVTVDPAQDGSTAAGHTAGDTIWVNPRYSDFDILRAVNDTLRELSSPGAGLFRTASVDLTYDPNLEGYDLTGQENVEGLLDIYYQEPSEQNRWIRVPSRQYRFQRNSDLTAFPSGFALTFFSRIHANDGATIRVTYKTRFAPLAAYNDNAEATTGLWCDALDLLWIGAAIRLTDSREIERNQTASQGDPRRAGEVPAGAQLNSYRGLQQRWLQRVASEASRAARRYPVYMR